MDAAVLAPLKPVSMSGDPHEDHPVFEDIKAPSRPLENPPDLAQVSPGKKGPRSGVRSLPKSWGFEADLALFFSSPFRRCCDTSVAF